MEGFGKGIVHMNSYHQAPRHNTKPFQSADFLAKSLYFPDKVFEISFYRYAQQIKSNMEKRIIHFPC